ncbi:pectate lyase family protein [Salipiger mangrovisoli]|uniref:Right-handed parallel beta-helix repeat-containing protein n=1 Tax=Salipiger mangrovisoli TaxID=2865933 RepID=A0ABR9WZD1_9RHOB|nr:right-handed parallel beta-helix repeat-containing protein [Salipiger mangrovisoli]MBE9636657.1 right-handed parallel beta-helix repeat-containing protein [Salipiger mangrovisoli]
MAPFSHIGRRSLLASLLVSAAGAATLLPRDSARSEEMALAGVQEPVGFGSGSKGGDDGRMLLVTSLADDGPGSLRWAAEEERGPRIIRFDIGGTIDLSHQLEIGPDVTLDGTTAPGGITITGGRLRVVGSNVIIRGMRLRPGDGPGDAPDNRDGLSIGEGPKPIRNVLVDGNSLSWSIDEALAVWGDVADVTISNNIISEALDQSMHPKGRHSMGLLIGGGAAKRITVIGNLLAHNRHRNPAIKDGSQDIEFINNLIYNWGPNGFQGTGSKVNIIGNVYVPGPNSVDRPPLHLQDGETPGPNFYLSDTIGAVRSDADVRLSDTPVFEGSNPPVRPASEVEEAVLATAGARLPELDSVDRRVIEEVRSRSGGIIDSPQQVIGGRKP